MCDDLIIDNTRSKAIRIQVQEVEKDSSKYGEVIVERENGDICVYDEDGNKKTIKNVSSSDSEETEIDSLGVVVVLDNGCVTIINKERPVGTYNGIANYRNHLDMQNTESDPQNVLKILSIMSKTVTRVMSDYNLSRNEKEFAKRIKRLLKNGGLPSVEEIRRKTPCV